MIGRSDAEERKSERTEQTCVRLLPPLGQTIQDTHSLIIAVPIEDSESLHSSRQRTNNEKKMQQPFQLAAICALKDSINALLKKDTRTD